MSGSLAIARVGVVEAGLVALAGEERDPQRLLESSGGAVRKRPTGEPLSLVWKR